jgi:hypothetical protein
MGAIFKHQEGGWYQVESFGEHPNRAAGVIQLITPEAGASIVEKFNAAAAAGTLPQGHELLIDHEHFKDDIGKESIAYGWLQELETRADGIYGRIRWTGIGQTAVDGGEYRYFSTEYDPEDLVNLGGDPPRVRPMRLAGLTLTNMPNNKGGKPITNRGDGEPAAAVTSQGACRAFGLVVNRKRATLKCSFDHAWNLASKEEPALFAAMHNRQLRTDAAPAVQRAVAPEVDFPRLANEVILSKAQVEQLAYGGQFEEHWKRIRNRYPRLVQIANREKCWDALADLEPAAHREYIRARANPNVAASKMHDAAMDLRSKFPNLRTDEQTQKLNELYPHLLSQYRLEQTALNPRFEKAMQGITIEFPDLGFEGRWEKLKQLYPKLFWEFVLTVGTKSEEAP